MKKTMQNTSALEFLAQIKSNSIDLVLTDPPYGISRKTGFKSCVSGVERFKVSMEFGEWDNSFTLEYFDKVISEYFRVLKPNGTAIIFYDLWKITVIADFLKSSKFKQLRFIEWIKTNPVPLNSKINYLTNSREIAITAVKKAKPTFNSQYDRGVYSYPICQDKGRFHPTQKPIKLLVELIEKHSNVGDIVLDTFAGSFSTYNACKKTNRSFIGCEADIEYFNKAMLQISNC